MSKAFIVVAEIEDDNVGWTWVPEGRKLFVYDRPDRSTPAGALVEAADQGKLPSSRVLVAGDKISNLALVGPEGDARTHQADSIPLALRDQVHLVGESPLNSFDVLGRLRLCTAPAACRRSLPVTERHGLRCRGIFNLVAETELHLIVCEALPDVRDLQLTVAEGSVAGRNRVLEGQALRRWVDAFLLRAESSPSAAMDEFRSLSREMIWSLLADPLIQAWADMMDRPVVFARSASELADSAKVWGEHVRRLGDRDADRVRRALPVDVQIVLASALRDIQLTGMCGAPPRPPRPQHASFAECWRSGRARERFAHWLTTVSGASVGDQLLPAGYSLAGRLREAIRAGCDTPDLLEKLAAYLAGGCAGRPALSWAHTDSIRLISRLVRLHSPSRRTPWERWDRDVRAELSRLALGIIAAVEVEIVDKVERYYRRYTNRSTR